MVMNNGNINVEELIIGEGTFIDPSAKIRGIDGASKRVVLGDNVYIGHNVEIICDDVEIGDYTKIHHHCNIHGYKPFKMGHNCWVGQFTIMDCIGGTTIGNNVGIGASSQLWSHILYGDMLEGNRFMSNDELNIGNDVWLVGHCIVSPVTIADKAMALVGSVITKDMEYNHVYAGTPAKDITDKVGPQFADVTIDEKTGKMVDHLFDFDAYSTIRIVDSVDKFNLDDELSYFDVDTRTYTKKRTKDEVEFMKFLLPTKAKFTPHGI